MSGIDLIRRQLLGKRARDMASWFFFIGCFMIRMLLIFPLLFLDYTNAPIGYDCVLAVVSSH